MKSYGIPGLILIALLIICLLNSAWLTRRCGGWQAQLDEIDSCARLDDWDSAGTKLDELYRDWLGVQTWLHITMEHKELDEAEALFCRAIVLAEEEDSVEFRSHIADLGSQLQLLDEMQQLSVENVL